MASVFFSDPFAWVNKAKSRGQRAARIIALCLFALPLLLGIAAGVTAYAVVPIMNILGAPAAPRIDLEGATAMALPQTVVERLEEGARNRKEDEALYASVPASFVGKLKRPPHSPAELAAVQWAVGTRHDITKGNARAWRLFEDAKVLQTRPSQQCSGENVAQVDLLLLDHEKMWSSRYVCVPQLKNGKFHLGQNAQAAFYTWAEWWEYTVDSWTK